ncbi:MAG: manganese efflux pump [Lachnospiraceae bacterium]|nr:manganese efflux pump [Lachnospiraceae bacterium]
MWLDIVLIGIGLSMDAFAVATCKGLGMRRIRWMQAIVIGVYFGGFQAMMPVLGWLLGTRFRVYIESADHWIAFGLLAFIGGKMIFEAVRKKEEDTEEKYDQPLNHKEMFVLAIATSIDALAVGISFAALGSPIVPAAPVIGVITFGLSVAGVCIGNRFGSRFEKKAEIAGGVILILIGVKVLIEHMGA